MEELSPRLAGLDFGARLSGHTVLALYDGRMVRLERVARGVPVDPWLIDRLKAFQPRVLAIDAPLSLPAAYFGRGADHHFRRCDRLLGAMSPMFLGGLTARAMALKHGLESLSCRWVETYPSQVALQRLGRRRDDREAVFSSLQAYWPDVKLPMPEDQHALDALLALWAARQVWERQAVYFGNPVEGTIAL